MKEKNKASSSWIGYIFGLWLSGIFTASLSGHIMSGSKHNIVISGGQSNKLNMILLLVAILWPFVYFPFSKHSFIPSRINASSLAALIVFLLFSFISVFFSEVIFMSTAYWLLTVASIWIALQFASSLDLKQLELGFKIYAVLLTGQMVGFATWEYIPGIRLGEARRIMEPAMIGMICLSGVMTSMAIRWKLIRFSILAILFFILYLTGSRAPTLAALFGVTIIFYLRTRASKGVSQLVVFLLLLVGIVGAIQFLSDIVPFVEDFLGVNNKHRGFESGGSGRLGIWRETWQLFVDNPIFGIGYRGHEARLTLGSSSHNGYLAMLAEVGIVGFCAIIFIIVSGILKLRDRLKKEKDRIYTYSIFFGICYSYLFLAIFERYMINSGNPTSILFLIAIFWSAVKTKRESVV